MSAPGQHAAQFGALIFTKEVATESWNRLHTYAVTPRARNRRCGVSTGSKEMLMQCGANQACAGSSEVLAATAHTLT